MRLIDADALLEATSHFCDDYKVHWTDQKVLVWIDHAPTIEAFLWSDAGSANIVARTKLYPEIGDTAVIEILTQHYVKTQIISAHAEKGRTVLAYVFRNRPPL